MTIWNKKLRPALIKGLGLILIALISASCEWGDRTITLVRPNTDNLQVIYTDTVTIHRSTVMKDSLNTSSGNIITGILEDNLLGTIKATGYMGVSTISSVNLADRAVYDSIAINTKIVYTYGDTTRRFTLAVHELLQDITRGPYYNHRPSEYAAEPIGQISFVPKPNSRDSLRIRISDVIGRRLFDAARTNNLNGQDALLRQLKGLVFVGEYSNKSGFLGFARDSTQITMYYHVDGPDGKTKYTVDFAIGQNYNQIANDRTNTQYADLVTARYGLPSEKTSDQTVIQAGVGLMTRLDLPHIHQFGYDQGRVVVNRAFLLIDLPRNPEVPFLPPPARVALYATNNNNDWEASSSTLAVGDYVDNDPVRPNARYYRLDVSQLVRQLVQETAPLNNGFLIGPLAKDNNSGGSSYTSTLDRLILPKGSIKLQVYFTTLVE